MCHLLPLTVRLLHRTQLLEQPLAGEPGHHEELILGKEVINELLLHFSCLARIKRAEVRTEQEEEGKALDVPGEGCQPLWSSVQSPRTFRGPKTGKLHVSSLPNRLESPKLPLS